MLRDNGAIDAARFRATLLAQKGMTLTCGLHHLIQIEFAYNSNRIEGSQLSADQTRYLFEVRAVDGRAWVDEVVETANHFRLFDVMLDAVGAPLTAERIRGYHSVLKAGTFGAPSDWYAVGDWKKAPNLVGGRQTTAPDEVAAAVEDLLAAYPEAMSFEDICDFHWKFETIHPFHHGNGRIGRMVMFQQCLAHGIMPFIVLEDDKPAYLRGLAEYESDPELLRGEFRALQLRYRDKYREFLPAIDEDAEPAEPLVLVPA
jgi:Fic family protein